MASSAPVLPQALLVASAVALGYAPELWPFGEITGTALIVSARAGGARRVTLVCRSPKLTAVVVHVAPVRFKAFSKARNYVDLCDQVKGDAETLVSVGTGRQSL